MIRISFRKKDISIVQGLNYWGEKSFSWNIALNHIYETFYKSIIFPKLASISDVTHFYGMYYVITIKSILSWDLFLLKLTFILRLMSRLGTFNIVSRQSGLKWRPTWVVLRQAESKVLCRTKSHFPQCWTPPWQPPLATQRQWAAPPLKRTSRHVCTGTCFILYCGLGKQIGDT